MTERRKPPSRKGIPATDAQKATLAAGRARRDANAKARAEKRAQSPKNEKSRHQMLCSGELDVRDLTDEELAKGRAVSIDGFFSGVAGAVPSKIVGKMHAEILRRHGHMMKSALQAATQTILDLATDPEAKDEVRLKAAAMILERNVGKVPEVVRIGHEDPWDGILDEVMGEIGSDEMDEIRATYRRMSAAQDPSGVE